MINPTDPSKKADKRQPLEFWFDFSSPYGYLASSQIDEVAADYGRAVIWRPFLLGAVFKVSGSVPLTQVPLKGAYARMDFARYARLLGVPLTLPTPFPVSGLVATRAYYWLLESYPHKAKLFAERVFEALYVEGTDVVSVDGVVALLSHLGIDAAESMTSLNTQMIKDKVRAINEEAIARGVFGSPFILLDDQAFWGMDRLWMVEEWLETGGW